MDFCPAATESRPRSREPPACTGLCRTATGRELVCLRLRDILAVRKRCGLETSVQVDVPEVPDKAMLVMIHRVPDGRNQMTVLNFSSQRISGAITSEHLLAGGQAMDMFSDHTFGVVDDRHTLFVQLQPFQGLSLLILPPGDGGPDDGVARQGDRRVDDESSVG